MAKRKNVEIGIQPISDVIDVLDDEGINPPGAPPLEDLRGVQAWIRDHKGMIATMECMVTQKAINARNLAEWAGIKWAQENSFYPAAAQHDAAHWEALSALLATVVRAMEK